MLDEIPDTRIAIDERQEVLQKWTDFLEHGGDTVLERVLKGKASLHQPMPDKRQTGKTSSDNSKGVDHPINPEEGFAKQILGLGRTENHQRRMLIGEKRRIGKDQAHHAENPGFTFSRTNRGMNTVATKGPQNLPGRNSLKP